MQLKASVTAIQKCCTDGNCNSDNNRSLSDNRCICCSESSGIVHHEEFNIGNVMMPIFELCFVVDGWLHVDVAVPLTNNLARSAGLQPGNWAPILMHDRLYCLNLSSNVGPDCLF